MSYALLSEKAPEMPPTHYARVVYDGLTDEQKVADYMDAVQAFVECRQQERHAIQCAAKAQENYDVATARFQGHLLYKKFGIQDTSK